VVKHYKVYFENGKSYIIHGESHTDAKKQAYIEFPLLKEIDIIKTELV